MKTVILALPLLLASALSSLAITTKESPLESTREIRESLGRSPETFVYEGLPREAGALKTEMKREDTKVIGGYPFYTPKTKTDAKVQTAVKKLVGEVSSYRVFSGEKRCGGFHPDYAITWTDGKKSYAILICYGCSEALVVDGRKTHRYDFKKVGEARKLLAPFQVKRPRAKPAK